MTTNTTPRWRYAVGDNIKGRIVLEQKTPSPHSAIHNRYIIHYSCCNREYEIQERALDQAASREDYMGVALCPACRRKNPDTQPGSQRKHVRKESSVAILHWPAPPSLLLKPQP